MLANRLSEDPSVRVALIEAGGRDRNPWIHIPAGYYRNFSNPAITWQFGSGPEPHLDSRTIPWPRGRVLGGSSSIMFGSTCAARPRTSTPSANGTWLLVIRTCSPF